MKTFLGLAAVGAFTMFGVAASAATIQVVDEVDDTNGSSGSYVSITCDCVGYDWQGMASMTKSEAVPSPQGNDASIISAFSTLTGIDTSMISVAYKIEDDDDGIADNLLSLDVLAGMTYFIKKADYFSFFTANSDGTAMFSESISNGGKLDVVPVPASGLLLLGGFGAFAAMRRRKKAA